jgi:hypothetical protein
VNQVRGKSGDFQGSRDAWFYPRMMTFASSI